MRQPSFARRGFAKRAIIQLAVFAAVLCANLVLPFAAEATVPDLLSRIPTVDEHQLDNNACGVSAATMLLDYHLEKAGKPFTDIRSVANYVPHAASSYYDYKTRRTIPAGTNTSQLRDGIVQAASQSGLSITAEWKISNATTGMSNLRAELDRGSPVVLYLANGGLLWNRAWNYGHFIVVSGYDSDAIIYHDPWDGKAHQLSTGSFASVWGSTWSGNPGWWYLQSSPPNRGSSTVPPPTRPSSPPTAPPTTPPTQPPTPQPTAAPPTLLQVTQVEASSYIPAQDGCGYVPQNLFDGTPCIWATVSGDSVGAWVQISLAGQHEVTMLRFHSFGAGNINTRIQDATLMFSDGSQQSIHLQDVGVSQDVIGEGQDINISPVTTNSIRIAVDSTYPGTRYPDADILVLQELEIWGR